MAFSKQFYVVPSGSGFHFQGFDAAVSIGEVTLFTSKALPVQISDQATASQGVAVIGEILSSDNYQLTAQDICTSLSNGSRAAGDFFDEIENGLFSKTGRYVVLAWWHGSVRLYLDALGSKSAYYCSSVDGPILASHPGLLSAIGCAELDKQAFDRYSHFRNSGGWPIHSLPYRGVKQVPANHYFDFSSGEAKRHWPKNDALDKYISLSSDEAVEMFHQKLSLCIKSMSERRKLSFPLTAGFDSRLLAACAPAEVRKSSRWFTITSGGKGSGGNVPNTPKYEVTAAQEIAKILDVEHKTFHVSDHDSLPSNTFHKNASFLLTDKTQYRVNGFIEATNGTLFCSGNGPEVFRCFYYPDGRHPHDTQLTAEYLAAIAGFANNPYAVAGMQKWLDDLPDNIPIKTLDLFYWEDRMSSWQSTVTTFREDAMDEVLPCNSRELISIALARPVEERKYPHSFVRSVIAYAEPELQKIDYNTGGKFGDIRSAMRAKIKHCMSLYPVSFKVLDGTRRMIKKGLNK